MITGQTTSIRIYNSIKQSLPAEVKHFALWSSQIDKLKEGEKNVFRFPAVFINFENNYDQLSVGRQSIDGTFVLHICLQSLKFKDEDILLFKDYIYQQLNKELPKYGFSDFYRRFEVQDTDYDNLMVWQQEYSYNYIVDDIAQEISTPVFPWILDTNVHY